MNPDLQAAMAQVEASLRRQLAARVAIGANIAGLPPDRRPGALRQLAALMLAQGEEPYSEAEACLLARQLAEVWRCIDRRAQARVEAS